MHEQKTRYVLSAEKCFDLNCIILEDLLFPEGFNDSDIQTTMSKKSPKGLSVHLTQCQINDWFNQLLAYRQKKYEADNFLENLAREHTSSPNQYTELYELLRDASLSADYLIESILGKYITDPWHSWMLRHLDEVSPRHLNGHFVLEDLGFDLSDRLIEMLDISSSDLERISDQALLYNDAGIEARLYLDDDSWELDHHADH